MIKQKKQTFLLRQQFQNKKHHLGPTEFDHWLGKSARRKVDPVRFLSHSRRGGFHPKIPL